MEACIPKLIFLLNYCRDDDCLEGLPFSDESRLGMAVAQGAPLQEKYILDFHYL